MQHEKEILIETEWVGTIAETLQVGAGSTFRTSEERTGRPKVPARA